MSSTLIKVTLALIAYYYNEMKYTLELLGYFRDAVPYDGSGNCRIIPGPEGCEDIVIHYPSGYAFMACGSGTDRLTQYWPPISSFTNEFRATPWDNVVLHSSASNITRLAAEGISHADGISANWDKLLIYVIAAAADEIIRLGYPSANTSSDEETGEIYIAAFPKILRFIAYSENPNNPKSPGMILKISNNTDSDRYFGKKYKVTKVLEDDGAFIHSITTPAVDHKRNTLLLGTIFAETVRCDLA
ncbi:1068_t:CDS:2 [Ambispora gerdemannii]|uniref:1068_t:CDS:1 n=1 Tax=Ambispora gerdemannii TaxID=144530 RepID=A0A9N8YQU7_9GLOM|nr:1068_t:CDS:2 [Ambispora gerdemannii]